MEAAQSDGATPAFTSWVHSGRYRTADQCSTVLIQTGAMASNQQGPM
jgi:hypothetical protein